MRRASALALAFFVASAEARADTAPPPAQSIAGVERPAREPGDAARDVLATLLWPARRGVELVYEASEAAAGLVESQQIVPRTRELLMARDGRIGLYPTFALASAWRPMPGMRMVAHGGIVSTTLSGAWAGSDDLATEGRVRFAGTLPAPGVLSIEGLHDRRSSVGFAGVGQSPATDPRNHFIGEPRGASYREARQRALVSLGLRPSDDVEVFASSSFTQRTIEDDRDGAGPRLDEVFQPESRVGSYGRTRFVYSEVDVRLDTRRDRARPSPGALVEGYAGSSRGVVDEPTRFLRSGIRAAAYLPIHRSTTILSPKLVVDTVAPIHGDVPFEELASQPEFRGAGGRRDQLAAVGSLDYRWQLARIVAARLFVDAARVAKTLSELPGSSYRWCVGGGVDLASASAEVGRFGIAAGPDGVAILLSFGVPSPFGDRQHRD